MASSTKVIKIKADFYEIGQVWINLTEREYNQMKAAHHAPWWLYFILPVNCPADFMSEELEDILCGHKPERYEIIIPWEKHWLNEERIK